MNSFFLKAVLLPFALLTAAVMVTACSQSNSQERGQRPGSAGDNIPAVEAVQARYGSLPLAERLSGTVISKNQVVLYPEISARISAVLVQTGDRVEKGEPLVLLRDDQYREQLLQARAGLRISEARLKQANARLNELRAQYNRTKTLAEKNLSSELEMETLEAQLASAEADVELAQAQVSQARSTVSEREEILSKTVIRAPISGTVGQRNAEVGMQAGTSTRLFTIGDLSRLRVEVVLTENMLNNIEIGQTARIYAGSQTDSQQVIEAELSRISPFLNRVTRSTEAEIDVINDRNLLRPGMFVPVDILYGESEQATLIPTSALYTNPESGEEGVYIATSLGMEFQPAEPPESGEPAPLTEPVDVQFRPIEVIARGRMELGVSGIQSGSWIVTVGQDLLSRGRGQARVRAISWERILALQGLQRQDLLERVLKRQEEQAVDMSQTPSGSSSL